jgi:hypothetical protein
MVCRGGARTHFLTVRVMHARAFTSTSLLPLTRRPVRAGLRGGGQLVDRDRQRQVLGVRRRTRRKRVLVQGNAASPVSSAPTSPPPFDLPTSPSPSPIVNEETGEVDWYMVSFPAAAARASQQMGGDCAAATLNRTFCVQPGNEGCVCSCHLPTYLPAYLPTYLPSPYLPYLALTYRTLHTCPALPYLPTHPHTFLPACQLHHRECGCLVCQSGGPRN